MHYRRLGHTDLHVSVLGLGTMTWGHQNSEQDAHQQLDAALAAGVNFIDTAEMYPTPTRAETWTTTERYLGQWLANRGRRDGVILASKIAGPARDPGGQAHIRDGLSHHDRRNIVAALEGSLRRLRTDYLDLYQLHWPDRTTNIFGAREYPYVDDHPDSVALEETLAVLGEQVKAGKVRYIGVSNETPGASGVCCATARPKACRASPASRTPTACSTGRTRAACRNSATARASACWPIRPWPLAP